MDSSRKKSLTGLLSRAGSSYARPIQSRAGTYGTDVANLSISEDEIGGLGLTTLYEPEAPVNAVADIVFIHGLGGGSRKTWSYSPDIDHYWPQTWLPADPDFEDVRIHVFGYKADWTERQQSALNIHDFAQSLVGELKNNPIIRRDTTLLMLIGHSMGGCVAKKAYILARQDPMCKDLVERVHSMFFLGTPHRGSDLASILENIITVAWGKKPFVRDLTPNSATLTEINDSFRHYAPELRLWSFYETLPVKAKVLNKIVVDKLSSTLGYPNEEIAAMNADHRHVCKFENEADPNYKTLRNAINTAVDMIRESLGKFRKLSMVSDNTLISADVPSSTPAEVVSNLRSYLGVQSTLEDDLVTLQILKEPGSCEWLATRNCFASWEERKGPQLLWLTGRPAAGKSVLSSHVIDRLRSRNIHCSYFFFKHAKSGKSTLSDCFLSLAFQMATQDIAVREKLLELQDDEAVWDRADEASVWRKLFVGGIFKVQSASQHYWVIDGVDECVNFNTLFTKKLLATMPSQLRVFAASRDLEEVGRGLISLGSRANLHTMVNSDTIGDMRLLLITKLMELDRLDNDKEREAMCERILEKSSGSFLWVRLVLQEFENAWTEEAMRAVLEEVPADLHAVYHRILQSIETDPRKQMLSKSILAWVCLAPRPLTTDELRCAVKIDISQTLQSMGKAIPNLCGQLVFVDKAGKVQIIHETAREFLLSPGLDSALAIPKAKTHTRLSSLLLSYLSGDVLKPQQVKSQGKPRGFLKAASKAPPDTALLSYALAFFSDHIYRCNSEDDDLMEDLCTFFKSYNVLSWIENIAQTGDLGDITRTAINLRGYLGRRAKYVAPTDRQIQLVDDWVMDLIRVATKFSRQLLACPSSIHCLIPPLCPPGSIIAKTFAKEIRSSPLVVKNIPDGTWDDCLIRIDYQKGQTTAVSHGDRYFAIGLSTGQLSIYDRTSIQRIHNLKHPERIRVLEFSRDDEYLVSCGNKQLVVWNPKSGAIVLSSQASSPILAITFIGGSEMLSVSQSSELTKWNIETGENETLSMKADGDYDYSIYEVPSQPPNHATFSTSLEGQDVLLAVGYRAKPVYIWSALELRLLGLCGTTSNNGIDDMSFNPNPEIQALVVSYTDGSLSIFNYTMMSLDFTKPGIYADSLACSPDGRSLITGSSQGVIQVFEFDQGNAGYTTLTPIYNINAYDDSIRGVAFSFDGLRFVDIGRRQCRVWEPTALVRKDSELESTSDVVALPAKTVGMFEELEGTNITSPLATSRDGGCVVAGKSNGDVVIFSTTTGADIGVPYSHDRGVSVVFVALSDSMRTIVSADDSGRVLVAEIATALPRSDTTSQATNLSLVRITIDRHFGGAVTQLLLSKSTDRLLVNGRGKAELWDLLSGSIVNSRIAESIASVPGQPAPVQDDSSNYFPDMRSNAHIPVSIFQHPTNAGSFVTVSGSIARVFGWANFAELTNENGIILQGTHAEAEAFSTLSYFVGSSLVVEFRRYSQSEPPKLRLWPAAAFDPSSDRAGIPAVEPNLQAISPVIQKVLGVVGGSKLVFLDVNLWICSTDLRLATTPTTGNTSRLAGPSRSSSLWSTAPPSINTERSSKAQARRHFFALSEWRDGGEDLNCAMVSGPATHSRGHGQDFAFVASHRILVIKGGLEFSEAVAIDTLSGTKAGSKRQDDSSGSPTAMTSGPQTWKLVSGSMHRRASNW